MTEKLKPCPFCGEDEDLAVLPDSVYYSVNCESCGTIGPAELKPEYAVAAWNRRAYE